MIIKFKIFENNNKFAENDYVLISEKWFNDGKPKEAKIESKNGDWYEVILIVDTILEMSISSKMIVRELTLEEIEKFELDCGTLKYNL